MWQYVNTSPSWARPSAWESQRSSKDGSCSRYALGKISPISDCSAFCLIVKPNNLPISTTTNNDWRASTYQVAHQHPPSFTNSNHQHKALLHSLRIWWRCDVDSDQQRCLGRLLSLQRSSSGATSAERRLCHVWLPALHKGHRISVESSQFSRWNLAGLITEFGRSHNGIWLISWRKTSAAQFPWRNRAGLTTEFGRSHDRICAVEWEMTESGRSHCPVSWRNLASLMTASVRSHDGRLAGLMTESGRSQDGIWPVSWRPLAGLTTESGRSHDEILPISGRNLAGLMTESGRSHDRIWLVS